MLTLAGRVALFRQNGSSDDHGTQGVISDAVIGDAVIHLCVHTYT